MIPERGTIKNRLLTRASVIDRKANLSGFSKHEYSFTTSQPWVRTGRQLVFLDEGPELKGIYDFSLDHSHDRFEAPSERDPGHLPTSSTVLERDDSIINSPSNRSDVRSDSRSVHGSPDLPHKRRRLTCDSPPAETPLSNILLELPNLAAERWRSSLLAETPLSNRLDQLPHSPAERGQTSSRTGGTHVAVDGQHVISTPSRVFSNISVWPLQDKEEARLLRYYVERLARSYDLTDPLKHFQRVVPQRAATCPTLLNAIFALSARHLSRTNEYDPLASNKYHQKCLGHLIPMLNDESAILDENLLASTTVLRNLEEIEVPLSGQSPSDHSNHLIGSNSLITAQERASISGGLRQAAFWVGLRQEIYVAFVNQRSIIPNLEYCNIDRTFDAAPDHIWSCRMVVICADVLRYCYDGKDNSSADYRALADSVEQWFDSKPASFTPVFSQPADTTGTLFPELWFVGEDVVTGLQHYHLSRILLAAHNPRIPRLGPGRAAALRAMDEDIKAHVRALCGICLGNPSSPPNFTSASMGIAMAGDKFTHREEQEAMLRILETCDRQHGYPTTAAVKDLKIAWGWEVN